MAKAAGDLRAAVAGVREQQRIVALLLEHAPTGGSSNSNLGDMTDEDVNAYIQREVDRVQRYGQSESGREDTREVMPPGSPERA
jgi:hypothetical protein